MRNNREDSTVKWNEWSDEAFNQAKDKGRLVLLDLTASWCHWCHVMDESTYDDPGIAKTINDNFVPVRVDIDKRPDISDRYNRGGFPTTAFLSDRGESIWGATFVPPADMRRIMESILKAKESGQIDQALERSRMQFLDVSSHVRSREPIDRAELLDVFEGIFSAYDVDHGGFGTAPKFPHPEALELLLIRYLETNDDQLADAVVNSLEQMASGLHDKVEGGVFRYSVTRDWQTPHYEKMLETNAGFLRNLAQAHGIIGDRGFEVLARDIAKYLITTLRNPESGGFYGSQDADEEYYKLRESARKKRKAPSVDKTVYAGWNSDASAVLTITGTILGEEDMLIAGRDSWEYALKHLWNPKLGLVRHVASGDIYLFADQVRFFVALLAQMGLSKDSPKVGLAEELIRGVNAAFASDDGGFNDVMKHGQSIGELDTPRRSLVENSNWALALAQFGGLAHRRELVEQARQILNSFTQPEIEAHGVFAAAYLRASWALDRGLMVVEIHEKPSSTAKDRGLLASAQTLFYPSIIPVTVADDPAVPYAIVCTDEGCSKKISDPTELLMFLKNIVDSRKTQPRGSG